MRGWVKTVLPILLLAACAPSDLDERRLTPPADLTAQAADDDRAIDLTWAASPLAKRYRIYRQSQVFSLTQPSAGPMSRFDPLAEVVGPDMRGTIYRDTAVEPDVRYFYRVTALYGEFESEPSNLASAAARRFNQPPQPTAPPLMTTKNRQGSVVVKANDPNVNDVPAFAVMKPPVHGMVKISAQGVAVYVPATGFIGNDRFWISVADAWGGKGSVKITVTVINRAPEPQDSELRTFKNTRLGYLLNPRDPDAGEVFAFWVSTPPLHGSATVDAAGLVTYTPAPDFIGGDAFALVVRDSSGELRGVTLGVVVVNRGPEPIAPPIMTELDTVGVSRILPQDPDPGETWVYTMVTAPTHGSATLSLDGRIDYTPNLGYVGSDYLEVRVTDGSAAGAYVFVPIAVDQTHLAAGMSLPLSSGVCGDAWTRVLITQVSPPANAIFTPGSDVPFTITLSYSSPVTQAIGVNLGGYGNAATTVEPGCGLVTLAGTAFSVSSAFWIEPQPNFSQTAVQYAVEGDSFARAAFTTVALARDALIRTPTFEFQTRIAYDLFDDAAAWQSYIGIEQLGGQTGYRAEFYPTVSQVGGMPFRLRGALGCGDSFATFQLRAQSATPTTTWGYAYLAFAAMPPAIRVDNFLTDLPVTSSAVTQFINLRPCAAATAVTFTTSAPWFSVEPTLTTLAAYAETPIAVTVDGAAIVAYGAPVTGTLWIWPFAGETFAPVAVPVSAVRHPIDLASYVRLGLTGSDDGSVLVDLPWPFPAHGQSYTRVEVTANGTANLTDAPCMSDWRNVFGPFAADAPGHYGCPLLALLWADHGFRHTYLPQQGHPDVYVRNVAGPAPVFEILFWDLQSRGRFFSHNVVLVKLYPNGRFVYEYPQLQAYGHESVGWWDTQGRSGPLVYAGALQSGDVLNWGPLP